MEKLLLPSLSTTILMGYSAIMRVVRMYIIHLQDYDHRRKNTHKLTDNNSLAIIKLAIFLIQSSSATRLETNAAFN
jgi:hypothetical protein